MKDIRTKTFTGGVSVESFNLIIDQRTTESERNPSTTTPIFSRVLNNTRGSGPPTRAAPAQTQRIIDPRPDPRPDYKRHRSISFRRENDWKVNGGRAVLCTYTTRVVVMLLIGYREATFFFQTMCAHNRISVLTPTVPI